jgi:hypothetical protein
MKNDTVVSSSEFSAIIKHWKVPKIEQTTITAIDNSVKYA